MYERFFGEIRSVTKYPFQKAIAVTVEHVCYLTTVAPVHSTHFSSLIQWLDTEKLPAWNMYYFTMSLMQ